MPESENQNGTLENPSPEQLAAVQVQADLDLRNQIQQTEKQTDPRIDALTANIDKLSKGQDMLMQLMQQNSANVQKATVLEPRLPTDDEFWKNPVNATKAILAAQNAPLQEAANALMWDTSYRKIKSQLMMYPQYSQAVSRYPGFEAMFDAQASQIPLQGLNVNSLAFLVNSVVGHLALTSTPEPVTSGTKNTQPANSQMTGLPVHLKPSSTSPKPISVDADTPELTENERVVANRFGISAKEFKAMQAGGILTLNPLEAQK